MVIQKSIKNILKIATLFIQLKQKKIYTCIGIDEKCIHFSKNYSIIE